MREITTELKIDKSGRIVIPEVYREELDVNARSTDKNNDQQPT